MATGKDEGQASGSCSHPASCPGSSPVSLPHGHHGMHHYITGLRKGFYPSSLPGPPHTAGRTCSCTGHLSHNLPTFMPIILTSTSWQLQEGVHVATVEQTLCMPHSSMPSPSFGRYCLCRAAKISCHCIRRTPGSMMSTCLTRHGCNHVSRYSCLTRAALQDQSVQVAAQLVQHHVGLPVLLLPLPQHPQLLLQLIACTWCMTHQTVSYAAADRP